VAQETGLPELLDTLRWRWHVVAIIAVAFLVGAIVYAQGLPLQYEGQAITTFAPRPGVDSGAATILLPKYAAYVTAPATIQQIAPQLGVASSTLEKAINATTATETANLTITVTLTNAAKSAEAANAFAKAAVDFSSTDKAVEGEIVANALTPRDPSGPPRKLMEAAALAVGLLLGIAVAFVIERQRPRLRTWQEIAIVTGYPVVGRVPRSRALRGKPQDALTDPRVGAAFRTLRTNLEREWQDRTVDVIVVTSPSSGDGKTTIAALFAESLARLGGNTLLIDADLRRPGLSASVLDGQVTKGLDDVLREKVKLEHAIRPGWTDRLSILPTKADPDAGDLLARRFQDVLREARERYDVVVIDTAPLLGTDDARTIATVANGLLLVISARSFAGPVNESVLALESLRAPVLGAIGNRLRESGRSYYYYT
jgi:capsular exopolysaccharide synthesis family protein